MLTSLKILAITIAMPLFFALLPCKIMSSILTYLFIYSSLAVGIGAPVLVFVSSSLGSVFPASQTLACHFKQLGNSFGGFWWLAG